MTFAFGGVGFAGTISEGEIAFREIWKQSDAAQRFEAIFQQATPEARCYALTALRELAPDRFKECAEQFRKNPPKEIKMMTGCIVSTLPGIQILEQIEEGKYTRYIPKSEIKKKPNKVIQPTPVTVTPP